MKVNDDYFDYYDGSNKAYDLIEKILIDGSKDENKIDQSTAYLTPEEIRIIKNIEMLKVLLDTHRTPAPPSFKLAVLKLKQILTKFTGIILRLSRSDMTKAPLLARLTDAEIRNYKDMHTKVINALLESLEKDQVTKIEKKKAEVGSEEIEDIRGLER